MALGPLVLASCSNLADIGTRTCGDGIIDAGEDCDSSADCGRAQTDRACRLLCETDDDCPPGEGFACGVDGVCRKPSGSFGPSSPLPVGSYAQLATGRFGDVDRDELLALVTSAGGDARPSVLAFDGAGMALVEDAPVSVRPHAQLAIADVTGDALTDVVVAPFPGRDGFITLRGDADRPLLPLIYSQFDAVAGLEWTSPAPRLPGPEGTLYPGLIGFHDFAFVGDAYELNRSSTFPRARPLLWSMLPEVAIPPQGPVPNVPTSELLGPVPLGDFAPAIVTGAHCSDGFAMGHLGASAVKLYVTCLAYGSLPDKQFEFVDRVGALYLPPVALPAPRTIAGPTHLGDVDGDGRLDVIVGADDGGLYVGYGRGDGSFHDAPGAVGPASGTMSAAPLLALGDGAWPLGSGDFDGDGRLDFVSVDRGLLLSASPVPCSEPGLDAPYHGCGTLHGGGLDDEAVATWTVARVADINGDGRDDLAASDGITARVDLLLSRPSGFHAHHMVATEAAITNLAVGDFDGRGGRDLAMAETTAEGRQLVFAFSDASGIPEERLVFQRFASERLVLETMPSGGIDDLLMGWQLDETLTIGALLIGNAARTPIMIRRIERVHDIVSDCDGLSASFCSNHQLAIGRFEAEADRGLAVIGDLGEDQTSAIWAISSVGDPRVGGTDPTEFDEVVSLPLGPQWGRQGMVVALDLDGDGVDELVLVAPDPAEEGASQAIVLRWERTPEGRPRFAYAGGDRLDLPIGGMSDGWRGQLSSRDVDGDGDQDLLGITAEDAPRLFVVINRGDGRFEPVVVELDAGLGDPRAAELAQLDTDAAMEVVVVGDEEVRFFELDADRVRMTAMAVAPIANAERSYRAVAVGDFDGDALADVVLGGPSGAALYRQQDRPGR